MDGNWTPFFYWCIGGLLVIGAGIGLGLGLLVWGLGLAMPFW